MTEARQDEIVTLIQRSSLGTPAAEKLRARTTSEERRQILLKAAARASARQRRLGAGFRSVRD